jgi:hypothetical protein
MIFTNRKQTKVAPLKLDVVELRKKLTLLKQGKLIASDKKSKKRRPG